VLYGPSVRSVKYRLAVASDVIRDGLGMELEDASGAVVAEVFRSDRQHTLTVNTFGHNVPVEELVAMIEQAKVELEPFEDGTPLSEANNTPVQSSGSN